MCQPRPLSWPTKSHFACPHSPPIMAYSKTISNAYVRRPVTLGDVTLVFLRDLPFTPTSHELAPPLNDSRTRLLSSCPQFPPACSTGTRVHHLNQLDPFGHIQPAHIKASTVQYARATNWRHIESLVDSHLCDSTRLRATRPRKSASQAQPPYPHRLQPARLFLSGMLFILFYAKRENLAATLDVTKVSETMRRL
jgi:hypothetical protein